VRAGVRLSKHAREIEASFRSLAVEIEARVLRKTAFGKALAKCGARGFTGAVMQLERASGFP